MSLLKAHRLAQGWTAREAVEELERICLAEGLGTPHVSIDLLNAWENGRSRPRPDTQDLLARLYKANAVRLGLAADYRDDDEPDLITSAKVVKPYPGEEESETERRALFHQVLAGSGLAANGRLLAEIETIRQQMDRTLTSGTINENQMDRLDETVLRYRREYTTTAPLPMLSQLMLEFTGVQVLAAQRQPANIQRRLSHVTATLAVLAADTLMKLGDTRQARAWYGTAKTAADDTGDPRLRALVRTQEAMLPYYYGDLEEVLRLVQEAQVIARGTVCSPVALAAAAEARARARMGDVAEAQAALTRAQQAHSMINGKPGMAFDFSEQRMYLYLSGTHAYLPDTAKALTVHEQALAAQPSGVAVLDPVLIRLDQAISMARSGDATIACELAENALLTMPSGHRTSIVFTRAREVLTAIPSGRQPKAISSFRDALQLEGPR